MKKIEEEEGRLEGFETLILNLLDNHIKSKENTLEKEDQNYIKDVVRRMFTSELDYLNEDPEGYFEIYLDEENW